MTTSVAVFGATSYVGSVVVPELARAGHRVLAVSRRPDIARLLLGQQASHVRIVRPADLLKRSEESVSAVINLAYVKTASPHLARRENRALIDRVHETAILHSCDRIVHVSTIAVFGYSLLDAPKPRSAPRWGGDLYIDSKREAERLLCRRAQSRRYELCIVRPGNVIGPGSPAWTAALAQRLLSGRPVTFKGAIGYSNATYVANMASYLRLLVDAPIESLRSFGQFHHLAEFASRSWEEFLAPMERVMGTQRVTVPIPTGWPRRSVGAALVAFLRRAYQGSFGAYVRAVTSYLPKGPALDRLFRRLKMAQGMGGHLRRSTVSPDDATFLAIVASPILVPPHVLPYWQPPVTFDVAVQDVSAWLVDAGFVVSQHG